MLDQNTDRMWYVIGAVIVGAAIILILNGTMPELFASVADTFEGKTDDLTTIVDGIGPHQRADSWLSEDFTYDGAIVLGFSESGMEKIKTNKHLKLPDNNPATGETITAVGNSAFRDQGLVELILPDSIQLMEDFAFRGNALTTVDLPADLVAVMRSVFYENDLTEVVLPEGVVRVGYNAFERNKITAVTIPESVQMIEKHAFHGNPLTSVTIPNPKTTYYGQVAEPSFNGNVIVIGGIEL